MFVYDSKPQKVVNRLNFNLTQCSNCFRYCFYNNLVPTVYAAVHNFNHILLQPNHQQSTYQGLGFSVTWVTNSVRSFKSFGRCRQSIQISVRRWRHTNYDKHAFDKKNHYYLEETNCWLC